MSDPPRPSGEFSSSNRFIEEYLRDEVLQGLPDHLVEFLRSTSVLERMSGPLCDAVLDQAGSAGMLEDLAESNVMVFRLDGYGEWYRVHQLLRGMLSDDLRRRDPELHSALHLRASVWWEERDEYDAAVRHAIAGGDKSHARDLIWKAIPSFAAGDQPSTLSRWLESFDHSALIRDSTLALAVAGCRLANGDPAEVEWWITVARDSDGSEYLPSGERRDGILALFDAMVGKDGLHAMREQAELACRLLPMSSPFRFLACMHEAWALHLEGDRSDALSKWDALVRMGSAPFPQGEAAGEAFFALAAIDDGNWVDAEARIERARAIVREHPLVEEKPAQVLVLAVSALWRAHVSSDATVDLNRARELLSRLSGFERWAAVVIRCALARTAIMLGDLVAARTLSDEAAALVDAMPGWEALLPRVESVRTLLDSAIAAGSMGSLTSAELRVLRALPSHLSLGEIAGDLFVTRNTIKSQVVAVYRKLGVSTRGEAVARARELGLLESDSD